MGYYMAVTDLSPFLQLLLSKCDGHKTNIAVVVQQTQLLLNEPIVHYEVLFLLETNKCHFLAKTL